MCVLKRTSLRYEPQDEKRNSLSHKDGTSLCKFGKEHLFMKIAFSFTARSNEDHTQNLPPAHDYQLFNHNQNTLKNVNELHWWTEMPVVAKPPREIPSMKLGLPQAIALKKKVSLRSQVLHRKSQGVCVCGSRFEKADLGRRRRQSGSPALAGIWAPFLHSAVSFFHAGGDSRSADCIWLAMNQQTVPQLSLLSWRKPFFSHLQADVLVWLMVTYSNLPFGFQSRKKSAWTPGGQQTKTAGRWPPKPQSCSPRQSCSSAARGRCAGPVVSSSSRETWPHEEHEMCSAQWLLTEGGHGASLVWFCYKRSWSDLVETVRYGWCKRAAPHPIQEPKAPLKKSIICY